MRPEESDTTVNQRVMKLFLHSGSLARIRSGASELRLPLVRHQRRHLDSMVTFAVGGLSASTIVDRYGLLHVCIRLTGRKTAACCGMCVCAKMFTKNLQCGAATVACAVSVMQCRTVHECVVCALQCRAVLCCVCE